MEEDLDQWWALSGTRNVTEFLVAGSDKELVYTGGLSLPRPSARPGPASLSVRFPLSELSRLLGLVNSSLPLIADVIGAADLVVVDTDYDNYALICICQVDYK